MQLAQFSTPIQSRQEPSDFTPQAQNLPESQFIPSDEIRDFVLAANVAAQDAAKDPAASTAPERVVSQLAGSAESATYLFALCENAPLGEVSELSYPLISSTEPPQQSGIRGHAWPGGEPNFAGFIHLTLPLLEDTTIAEIECVLDLDLLPLPGERASKKATAVAKCLLAYAEDIAIQFGRTRAQITLHYPANHPPSADPFYFAITHAGYQQHLGHVQAFIPVEKQEQKPVTDTRNSRGPSSTGLSSRELNYEIVTWLDFAITEQYSSQIRELLTIASVDVPNGGLELEPIHWTPSRMAQAAKRLRARGGTTLLVGIVDKHTGKICALTEIARHYGSDPSVAEWTLTVTARENRNQGLAKLVKRHAIAAARAHWPSVQRIYGSVPEQPDQMRAIYRALGASEFSCSSTWEKSLDAN